MAEVTEDFSRLVSVLAGIAGHSGVRDNPVMNSSKNVELALMFLTGLFVGGAGSWAYVRFLRATIRFYEEYIQERIDRQFADMVKAGALRTRA